MRPHPRQPRQHVLQLRQLHLHLRLARSRARREDVQNKLGPIHHPLAGGVLDVLALRRRQFVVEHHQRCVGRRDLLAQLLDLALPQVRRRIGLVDLLRHVADDVSAGGVDETLQLLEMLPDLVPRIRPLAWRSDEDRSLDGCRQFDQILGD